MMKEQDGAQVYNSGGDHGEDVFKRIWSRSKQSEYREGKRHSSLEIEQESGPD